MSQYLYTSIAALLFIFTAFVIVAKLNSSKKVRLLLLVLLALSGFSSYRASNIFFGKPKVLSSTKLKGLLVGFFPDVSKKKLYLWVVPAGSTVPVSYVTILDKSAVRKLEGNRKRFKGKPYPIEIKGKMDPKKPFGNEFSHIKIELKESVITMPPKNRDNISL